MALYVDQSEVPASTTTVFFKKKDITANTERGGGQKKMYQDQPKMASIRRRLIVLLISLGMIVVYLIVGGVVMMLFEEGHEDSEAAEVNRVLANITDESIGIELAKERLNQLGCSFRASGSPMWTFTGGVFYAMTVITTIGYGTLHPQTFYGKAFTIIYSVFGIALLGNMLTDCAQLLAGISKGTLQRVMARLQSTRAPRHSLRNADVQGMWDTTFAFLEAKCIDAHEVSMEEVGGQVLPATYLREVLELSSGGAVVSDSIVECILELVDPHGRGYLTRGAVARAVSLWHEMYAQLPEGVRFSELVMYVVVTVLWVVVWSFAFAGVEGWDVADGIWFGFTTITTIGFGDYVPLTTVGRLLAFLFIIPGLGMSVGVLSTIWKVFDYHRYWLLQRLCRQGAVSKKMLEVHGMRRINSTKKMSKSNSTTRYLQKVRIGPRGSSVVGSDNSEESECNFLLEESTGVQEERAHPLLEGSPYTVPYCESLQASPMTRFDDDPPSPPAPQYTAPRLHPLNSMSRFEEGSGGTPTSALQVQGGSEGTVLSKFEEEVFPSGGVMQPTLLSQNSLRMAKEEEGLVMRQMTLLSLGSMRAAGSAAKFEEEGGGGGGSPATPTQHAALRRLPHIRYTNSPILLSASLPPCDVVPSVLLTPRGETISGLCPPSMHL